MSSHKTPDIPSDGGLDVDIDEKHADKYVVITNIPPGTKKEDLFIYFQKSSNGGGEVNDVKMLGKDKAVVIFDEEEVAQSALSSEHSFNGTILHLEPYINNKECPKDIQIFSLVTAKVDPSRFKVSIDEVHKLLIQARKKTNVNFLEICDGFLVTGTLEQIDEACLFLSHYAKSGPPLPARHKTDDQLNGDPNNPPCSDDDDDDNDAKSDLKPLELDILPKLMTIIQKKVEAIERKYKIKIEWKQKDGKARLIPKVNDGRLFYQGKEEFISLYQKEFQDLKETDFALKGVNKIADLDGMLKELMTEFSVVIEKTSEKNLYIFGKEDRVSQVKQRLQAKFGNRRQRRPPNGRDNDQMPRPDIFPPLSKILDNGIVLSVHQGDITKVAVDVVVNAANERLDHGGGVAGAIVRQGGRQIQQESDYIIHQYGSVAVGKVVGTGPGSLPCKGIIHAVGPQWNVHGEEGSRNLIFVACMNSFHFASNYKMCSIALPGISSGVYGVPKFICAEMMFTAAENFSAEAPSDNQLKDIRFINIDSPTYEAFRREFLNRYAMKKATDTDLTNTDGNTHVTSSSPVGHKVTEMPRVISNLQGRSRDRQSEGWISMENTNQQAMERDERRKRAEAAARREEQRKKNEKAMDGEKTANETMVKSRPNVGFRKGFEAREGEIKGSQEMKSKENSFTDNKHALKSESKDKSVTRNGPEKVKEEKEKMKPLEKKGKKVEEKKKKEEGEEEEKAEKEKRREKEKEKEGKEEELEDKKETEIERDTDRREKKENTETVSQSKMHKEPLKNGEQNGQQGLSKTSLGSSMKNENGMLNNTESEVTDGKPKQQHYTSDKTEGNGNEDDGLANMVSDMKIGDKQSEIHDDSSQPNTLATTKEEEGSNQETKLEQNLNKESKIKPDALMNRDKDTGVFNNPPKQEPLNDGNVQVQKDRCKEKSYDGNVSEPKLNPTAKETQTNQGGFLGRGVTFEKQRENKSLKTSGRGRGALKVAANLTGNKGRPGHAVRDEDTSSEFDKAQAASNDKDNSSKRPIKKPPGLTVTKEGLALVEKSREEMNEVGKGDNQDKDNKNANKKCLKSVFPITAGVEVPVKKPRIDEGNIEENYEEGTTKQRNNTEEIKEHGDQVLAERCLNGNDEFKEEVNKTSEESKKDFQNYFEDKNLNETKNVQNKEEETFEDHRKMDNIQTGLITSDGKENEPDISSGEDISKEYGLSNDGNVEVRKDRENKTESKDLGNGGKDNSKLVNQNSFNKTATKLKNNSDGPPPNEKPGPLETTERAETSLEGQVDPKTSWDRHGDNRDGKSTGISEQDMMNAGNHLLAEATSSKENLDAVGNKGEGQECFNKKASAKDSVSEKATNHDKAVADSKERVNDASDPKPFEEDNPTWDISLTETGPSSMESFEVLSMTFAKHIGSTVPSRTSGSSDESTESIAILDKDIEFLDSPSPDNSNKNESIDPTGPETDNSSSVYSTGERMVDVTRKDDEEETLQSSMTPNEKDERLENSVTGFKEEAGSSSDQKDMFEEMAEGTSKDDENIETKSMVDVPPADNSADSMKKGNNSEQEPTSVSPTTDFQECGMCFNTINPVLALKICDAGHMVCKTCFNGVQSSDCKSVCPTCHRDIPRFVLQPPNGQMKSGIMERNLLGYEGCGTLYVDYEFPGGIQSPLHPNPGSPYSELSRRTFLPDNKEGREVLELLRKAFDVGILFTVGKSTINGKDNQIIFNADIEHKTNLNGGPSVSGYPDPDYLDRVKTQLKKKGIE